MRVLLVTPDYPPPPGGIQTLVKNLKKGLSELGHDVLVHHHDPDSFEYSVSDLIPRQNSVYSSLSILGGNYIYLNSLYRLTKKKIEEFSPDVVHTLHIGNYSAILAAQENDIPTVVSTHAKELENQDMATKALQSADVVHAVSKFTQGLVYEIAPTAAVEVIPPSIDVFSYKNQFSKDTYAVTIARLVDRKNISTLVRVWEGIEDCSLHIVGDGPNKSKLEVDAENLSNICFHGWLSESEKRKILSEASLFVLTPTKIGDYDAEGFGIVYLEAQATNTPIIASNSGAVREAVGDAGLIAEDEFDVEEIRTNVKTLLNNSDKREECIEAAEERISRFSIQTVAERYQALYRQMEKSN